MAHEVPSSTERIITDSYPFEMVSPALAAHKELIKKYPLFLRAAIYPDLYPCNLAHWGIQCGPGWTAIIDVAVEKIEYELHTLLARISSLDFLIEVDSRIQLTHLASAEKVVPNTEAASIVLLPYCKAIAINDMGELYILISEGYICDERSWSRINNAIANAIDSAFKICERCGRKGTCYWSFWGRVYCEKCASRKPITNQVIKKR